MMAFEHQVPGKRTLATVVDTLVKQDPTRLICKAPKGLQVADGFSDITLDMLSKAVDSTAWLIMQTFGTPGEGGVLLYLGENDIRYLVFITACQKTGYKSFLPSARNSIDVHHALLEQTGCSGVVFGASHKDQAEKLKSFQETLVLIEAPPFVEMIANFSQRYPYSIEYEEIEGDTAMIVHSSGTTGLPKPIHLTYGYLGVMDKQSHIPVPKGRTSAIPIDLKPDDLLISTAPFFHIMGIYIGIMSVFNGIPFVCFPCSASLTIPTLVDVIRAEAPTVAIITPNFLEAIAQSPSALETLSTLRKACIGGAPLAPEVGDILNKRMNLVTALGASELGLVPSLIPEDKADWEYFEWNPSYELRMDPIDEEHKLHELVILLRETRDFQGIFHTFPDLTEYRTKDLFSPHPSRIGLWKYTGRLDDRIALMNGQKINPIPMEKIIENHPVVSRAVVVGDRRLQPALLVEPSASSTVSFEDSSSITKFVHSFWPVVEQANDLVPAGVQIGIMRIGVASPDKPFRTTPKGSIQRQKVLQDYKEEIEKVYQHDEYWTTLFRNG